MSVQRILCTAGVATGLLLAASAPATAHVVDVTKLPWPYGTITYYVSPLDPGAPAMERAARAWNKADVGYRFRPASQQEADFRVFDLEGIKVKQGTCVGRAIQGYGFAQSLIGVGGDCDRYVQTLAYAHEIGHLINLDHDDTRCAVMNTHTNRGAKGRRAFARPDSCRPGQEYWRKPVRADDAAGGEAARRVPFRFPEVICYPRDEPRSPIIRNALLCNKQYDCRAIDDPNPIGAAAGFDSQTGRFPFLDRCRESDYRLSSKRPAGPAGPLRAVHTHTFGARAR